LGISGLLETNENSTVGHCTNVALSSFSSLSCASGSNQITKHFDIASPTLEEYISNIIS
jgi:type VI protein secretion system component Hcp